ncbi:hypothetical protein CJ030_MR6G019696 [Morella rubra]|uniref:Transmembrane protein n=1 Tax=Morella rubra TaxID=262757 RepID=A0A6A1VIN4_9ROSI|nr:hypothetical protein CJ030_MR6G019709 [Morella rubra]KAB1210913.1 hypothetical protein CJ030_MR6G019696 [Morella rubra]
MGKIQKSGFFSCFSVVFVTIYSVHNNEIFFLYSATLQVDAICLGDIVLWKWKLRDTNCDLRLKVVSFGFGFVCFVGFANDPSSTKENNAASHGGSSGSVGVKVLILCLGLVAVVGFGLLLFKIWQKKKKEEQHARLLKLFEDDDELEVELGIRD